MEYASSVHPRIGFYEIICAGGLTRLAFVIPVGIDYGKVELTQAGHEWHFPHNGLHPKTLHRNTYVATVGVFRYRFEGNGDLVGSETVALEVI